MTKRPPPGPPARTKTGLQAATRQPVYTTRLKLQALAVASAFGSFASAVHGNPIGAQVVNGQATFNAAGNTLTITNSPGAVINWQSFSIGASEITKFQQQSASSAVLNRVVGADPSSILGQLQSNGKVFLINPNGIVFGQGARIDVGGLVASTLNITNADFAAGKLKFAAGRSIDDALIGYVALNSSGVELELAGGEVGVRDVEGGGDQAADVDARALAKHDAVRVDQEHLAVRLQLPEDRRRVGADDAIEHCG